MGKTDTQTIKDIKALLKKRGNKPKPAVSPTEPSTEGLAEEVVFKLLQQLNKGSVSAPEAAAGPVAGPPTAGSPQQLKPSEEKFKIAQMTMSLSKNISILCILIFTLPFIAILVTMMGQETVALLISMMAMIYPSFLFFRSLSMQTYISRKYGLKPLLRMPTQQQQMMPVQQRTSKDPYGIYNQPNPQQKKQNQEFF